MIKRIATNTAAVDNFDFNLVGPIDENPFLGYASAPDKTAISPQMMIRGSKNVYKKLSGTLASRPGLKLRGAVDATLAGTTSSFDWYNSLGNVRELRVNNGKLQVESDVVTPGTFVWYDLLTSLTTTRWVFDTWWDNTNKKDVLLGIGGTHDLISWNGGISTVASTTATTIVLAGTNSAILQGFNSASVSSIQTVSINGNSYTYTGTGNSPSSTYSQNPTNNKFNLSSTSWISQKFTTGASSTQILNATVRINSNASQTATALFTAAIYTDNSGVPGTLISSAQGSIPGSFSSGDFSVTFTFNLTDAINTSYHLVVYTTSSNTATLAAYYGVSGAVGTNNSTDSGTTWNAQNGYVYASINENTVSSTTLTGVSPSPVGEATGSVVLQTPVTHLNLPDANFVNDFLKVINNQVWIGSYSSRTIYISSHTDFTNYTVPVTRAPGDPELLILDNVAKGITISKGNGWVSAGTSDWYEVSFSNITVGSVLTQQTNVSKKPTSSLSAALGHEFIDVVNDNIIALTQDQQVRHIGIFANQFENKYPSLSLAIKDELAGETFTGGHLRIIGDVLYLTAPASGRDYMYETRENVNPLGQIVTERFWHAPQIRNVSRFAVINGVVFGHSNSFPQLYQVWDTLQWHDDSPNSLSMGVPYDSYMRLAYQQGGRRQGKLSFDKLYVEGYITQGTKLYGNLYYDYQGSTGQANLDLNSQGDIKTYYGSVAPSLGDSSLGDNPLGDGLTIEANDQEMLPKFRIIKGASLTDCFEYAIEIYTQDLDSRWEILAIGTNAAVTDALPTEIVS